MSADFSVIVIVCTALIILTIKLYVKFTTRWDKSHTCLIGKTAIVTGSNTGIGFHTAQDFAKRGARVILACRNQQQAEEARIEIIETTGNPNIIVRIVDLSSMTSIRNCAKVINATEERLDILVNNAGVYDLKHSITPDGLSLTMQINHFGPFLLTILLLDLLKRSAPSRIVILTSISAHVGILNLKDLNAPADGLLSTSKDYCNSKLLNILFANELSRKLKDSGVDVNSVHPGLIQTKIFRHLSGFKKATSLVLSKIMYQTIEEGVQTVIYVAVSKDVRGVTGKYFSNCTLGWIPKSARNVKLAQNVWKLSEEFVKLTPEEKSVFISK